MTLAISSVAPQLAVGGHRIEVRPAELPVGQDRQGSPASPLHRLLVLVTGDGIDQPGHGLADADYHVLALGTAHRLVAGGIARGGPDLPVDGPLQQVLTGGEQQAVTGESVAHDRLARPGLVGRLSSG
jgi:hypothetical protein